MTHFLEGNHLVGNEVVEVGDVLFPLHCHTSYMHFQDGAQGEAQQLCSCRWAVCRNFPSYAGVEVAVEPVYQWHHTHRTRYRHGLLQAEEFLEKAFALACC